MIRAIFAGLLGALPLLAGAAVLNAGSGGSHVYPEAESYLVSEDALGDVDAALLRAAENDTRVMLVMGANWCHDSRALAGWLATERFAELIDDEFELVFVNIGMPQSGDGHNLAIAQRFGLEELPGTPNLLVITPEGELINADSATTWRNAASRDEDAIFDELERLSDAVT